MGRFAQTDATIYCDNPKVAKQVRQVIRAKEKTGDFNDDFDEIILADTEVFITKHSCRDVNLRYQCQQLWKYIKDIKGVKSMDCPFMVEDDGEYFTNEPEE